MSKEQTARVLQDAPYTVLTTQKLKPGFQQMTITPDLAREIQKRSVGHNFRSLRPHRVESLRRDMASGCWVVNKDTLGMTEDWVLWDGQHRIAACIAADTPFITWVMVGPETITDRNTQRTFSQELAHRKVKNASVMAATLRMSAVCQATGRFGDQFYAPTYDEMFTFLKANPKIRESVDRAVSTQPQGLSSSLLAALHYEFSKRDRNLANAFLDALSTRINVEVHLKANDPVAALRKRGIDAVRSRVRIQYRDQEALCIKAWNLWRSRSSNRLVWTPVGPRAEEFPTIK